MPKNSDENSTEFDGSERRRQNSVRRSYETAEQYGRRAVRELLQEPNDVGNED